MKYLITIAIAVALAGCNQDSTKETYTVDRLDANVTNGEVIVLDENQSIGYRPNTDVTIINMGDNSYFVSCNAGECPVHIDNSQTDDNSDNSDNSQVTYDSNTSGEPL